MVLFLILFLGLMALPSSYLADEILHQPNLNQMTDEEVRALDLASHLGASGDVSNAALNYSNAELDRQVHVDAVKGLNIVSDMGSVSLDIMERFKSWKGLARKLSAIPYVGVAASILSAATPDPYLAEFEKVKQKLDHLDMRVDSLAMMISDLKHHVTLKNLLSGFASHESIIFNAWIKDFKSYIDNHIKGNAHYFDYSIKNVIHHYTSRERTFKRAIEGMLFQLNGYGHGRESFFHALYRATRGDWKKVANYGMYFESLIAKGVATYTLGCQLNVHFNKAKDSCVQEANALMGNDLLKLAENVDIVLNMCRQSAKQNRQMDVEQILFRNNNYLNNAQMAITIAKWVRNKYFWIDQTVVCIDKDIEDHDMEIPDNVGLVIKNKEKRHTFIMDGDQQPDPFAVGWPRTLPKLPPLNLPDTLYRLGSNLVFDVVSSAKEVERKLKNYINNPFNGLREYQPIKIAVFKTDQIAPLWINGVHHYTYGVSADENGDTHLAAPKTHGSGGFRWQKRWLVVFQMGRRQFSFNRQRMYCDGGCNVNGFTARDP